MTTTLSLDNLHTYFQVEGTALKAVRGVGFREDVDAID